MSDRLEHLRLKIFNFADIYKIEQQKQVKPQKEKKKDRKRRHKENPEESRVSYNEDRDLALLESVLQIQRMQNAIPEYVPIK